MDVQNQATRIRLRDVHTAPMRAFHMSWVAFFVSFFAWFGVAPLMAVIREDLRLTNVQIGNTIIASVAITILVRVLIGPACDRFGPRLTYGVLLTVGSLPVIGIGLADDYTSFLLFRLGIGAIGASFVITQFHNSVMFAPNVVGTANATTAGWGNLGGGVTQIVMPLVFSAFVSLGVGAALGWRLAMVVPGVLLFVMGIAYLLFTQDAPDGSFRELRASGASAAASGMRGSLGAALRDSRVWILFVVYAACFGVELTINNVAALYFHDRFALDLKTAGLVAGLFGLMNLFARALGGVASDRLAIHRGLPGRTVWLTVTLLGEGVFLIAFSRMGVLGPAILVMLVFSLFVQMAEGATFALVPFVNRRSIGTVAGIVGAGGNVGAVAAGFLFRTSMPTEQILLATGAFVCLAAGASFGLRFSPNTQAEEREAFALATGAARGTAAAPAVG